MRTKLGNQFGLDFSLFAFSYQPEVVAAVCKAGGMGVLGALRFTADELQEAMNWLDKELAGTPYGVDIVMPSSSVDSTKAGEMSAEELESMLKAMIPDKHWEFIDTLLKEHGVPDAEPSASRRLLGWTDTTARPQVEVAFSHDIAILASALGPPPKDIVDAAHERNIPVAGLVGRTDQALRQKSYGVDIIVAQGYEAGGHTGEVASMVLLPEVIEAVGPDTPVLAAGGIGTGAQILAAEALGAQGVWTGSIWIDTFEHGESFPGLYQKIHDATSSDTVRSRALTGKPARQLRTAWTDAWEAEENPKPLGMPLQYMVASTALERINRSDANELKGTPIGQIIGAMNETRSCEDVITRLRTEYDAARKRVIDNALITS